MRVPNSWYNYHGIKLNTEQCTRNTIMKNSMRVINIDFCFQCKYQEEMFGTPENQWGWEDIYLIKIEYHASEKPLQNSKTNSICSSKVNVSNNQKNIPYHTSFKKNTIKFLGFYIKNSSF